MLRRVAAHPKFSIPLLWIPIAILGLVCIGWGYRPATVEHDLAARAPLMALPGVDLQHFDESVELLDRAANVLADLQETERDGRDVRESLYPLSFLRAASDLEEARRAFVESGSREDRNIYVAAEYRTLNALRYDLARFEQAFVRQVPKSDSTYVAAGRMIDRASILETLSTMRKEIAKTARDIRVRQWCSLGVFDCSIPSVPVLPSSTATTGALDMDQIHYAQEVMAEILEQPDIQSGPIIETDRAACITRIGQANVFSIYDEQMPEDMPHARRTMIASDLRFLRTSHFPQVPLYSDLAQRGVEYVLASPLHHYTCMYEGADAGQAAAIAAIHDAALTAPFSAGSKGESGANLRTMERTLSGDIVRESDVRLYVEAALASYEQGELDAASSMRATELALALAFKTPAIPDTLILQAKTEILDAEALERGVPADLSAHNLFFSRSGFQNTFMTYNSSVYSDSPLTFVFVSVPPSREPYVYLSELPNTPAMRRSLIQDARALVALLGHPF